ncbi:MAG: CesT family type III secretion system chaperone [Gemmatimonadota bacterium]
MVKREDIESFLIRSEVDFQEVGDGIWYVLTNSEEIRERPGIVVNFQPPVIVFRADIRDLPIDDEEQLQLYRRLLELNAVDLVHGAYGLEDGNVILSDTLELENLDFSEFRASLESLALAVTSHLPELTLEISE